VTTEAWQVLEEAAEEAGNYSALARRFGLHFDTLRRIVANQGPYVTPRILERIRAVDPDLAERLAGCVGRRTTRPGGFFGCDALCPHWETCKRLQRQHQRVVCEKP